jgi:hypothetical protein
MFIELQTADVSSGLKTVLQSNGIMTEWTTVEIGVFLNPMESTLSLTCTFKQQPHQTTYYCALQTSYT